MGHRGVCLAVLALLAPLQLLAAAGGRPEGAAPPDRRTHPAVVGAGASGQLTAAPVPLPAYAAGAPAAGPPPLVTEADAVPDAPMPAPSPAPPAAPFAERFPAQAAALQDPSRPATTRWALLIGINEHRGTVANNIGSRQDAEDLRAHLLASGWRDDHILLLTDHHATRANIVDGIAWLAERTDQHSVGILHYSGHSKKWQRDVDGDGEPTDEGLWPSDDRYIPDGELVRLLDPVRPRALWISFATCNAAGMADPGLDQPHRILTFSSGEPQKSYEHPNWGNSVWGWLMIEQAFGAGVADGDGDGRVTVEEAFEWARPRAHDTTAGQRYGAQDGVLVDLVPGDFDLLIPGAPRPPSRTPSEPAPDPASPAQTSPDHGQQAAPPPQPTEEHQGNRICLLCSR